MRKLILMLLSIAIIAIFIISCKNNADNTVSDENTSVVEQSEETDAPDDNADTLPEYDFDGKTLTIVSRVIPNTDISQITADAENGEAINDAVYKRNLAVSERFNVNIKSILYEEAAFEPAFKKSILAGNNDFQLAAMHIMNSGVYATSGLLIDWNTLPNIDTSQPWWNQTIIKNTQIGGKLFLAQNDIPTYTVICNNHIMFYNKNIAQNLEIPNLYDIAKEGKWTIARLSEFAKAATKDLNGDGVMNKNDQWGLIASVGSMSAFLPGSNQEIMKNNNEGIPELSINTQRTFSIVEKVYELCITSGDTYMRPIAEEDEMCKMFKDGPSLFYNGFINDCAKLRDMEDEYGILPIPKLDEAQDNYYTQAQGNTDTVGIPSSLPAEDYEFVGTVVEALAAESYKTVRPAIYEVTLKTKFARDAESEQMLDLVTKNVVIDFGFIYDNWNGFAFTLWELMEQKSGDFASYYEKKVDRAQKNYDTVIQMLLDLK